VHGRLAVAALAQHGKDQGHPAGLNLADYKGDDFALADLA
jgi:uncharacterized protein with PIN domain